MKVIITKNSISKYFTGISKYFTGICKTLIDNSIRYFKYGLQHREDGPAVEFPNGDKYWYYKGKYYGCNFYKLKTWKKKIKQLKRQEKLKIFV